MDIKEAQNIIQQCVDNTAVTVKDAEKIIEAWKLLQSKIK